MKAEVFKTAWQFFRQTGVAFAECLKKAWANYKLTQKMRKGIVKFYFQKVDGTIREAWGTLKSELLPPTESTRRPNPTVLVYFDTEKQEYRCFKKFNLVA